MTPEISVVVPLRDEAPNLPLLHDEWTGVLAQLAVPYEIILVDDGSDDGTFRLATALQQTDPSLRVVRLSRPFGQTGALSAGFDLARGRFIVTADGDLQSDPADLPRMLKLAPRFDLVCGWRRHVDRRGLLRRGVSRLANALAGLVSEVPVHDSECGLKVFKADMAKRLALAPGMHRWLPALVGAVEGTVAEAVVNHRPRRFGTSKYGFADRLALLGGLPGLRARMREVAEAGARRTPCYEVAEVREPGSGPLLD